MNIQPTDLAAFRECVEKGYSIVGTRDGNWYCRWTITQVFRKLLGWQGFDDLKTAQFYKRYLRSKEVQSSAFTSKFTNDSLKEIAATSQTMLERIRPYIEQEKALREKTKEKEAPLREQLAAVSQSVHMEEDAKKKIKSSIKQELRSIKEEQGVLKYLSVEKEFTQHSIAQKYRPLLQRQIHNNRRNVADDSSWIQDELQKWKATQFPPISDKVNKDEKAQLRKTCDYPEVVQLLRNDPEYKDWYFRFVFRNSSSIVHAVDIAVQFPTTAKLLVDTYLDKRVKRLQNDGIQFQETKEGEKEVQLLIEGVYRSLLDETQVIKFLDGTQLSMANILQDLKEKNYKMGDLEYLQAGLSHCTPKNPSCDLTVTNWWQTLPIFETLSKTELEKRYKVKITDYAHLMVRASAQSDGLNVLDNHSWLLIAIPIGGNLFNLYPIGKYANEWPTEGAVYLKSILPKTLARLLLPLIETFMKLFFIFKTKRAIITCCDENEFYYHRKHFFLHKPLSQAQSNTVLEKIRNDLIKVREGNLLFQPQGDNCSSWVQETYDTVYPGEKRLFAVPIIETQAPAPLDQLLGCIKTIGKTTTTGAKVVRISIATFFGGWWGSVINVNEKLQYKPLVLNDGFLDGVIQLPAAIYRNRDDVKIGVPA